MVCTICNSPKSGSAVQPADMRRAVQRGFNPFAEGLATDPGAMLGIAGDSYETWREEVTTGRLSQTDWEVCDDCMVHLRPYLEQGPSDLGPVPAGLADLAPEAPAVAAPSDAEPLEATVPPSKRKKARKARAGAGPTESLTARLAKTSPYVVMLGLSLLALLIGALFFLLELRLYKFDFTAKEAKQRVMAPVVEALPPPLVTG